MTNPNDENKPKKLTLSTTKLSLNRNLSEQNIRSKNVLSPTSNTIIEVKKSVLTLNSKTSQPNSDPVESTNDEVNKKLNILRKAAAENLRLKDNNPKFSSLSKLAAMNQEEIPEAIIEEMAEVKKEDELEPEIIAPNIPLIIQKPILEEKQIEPQSDLIIKVADKPVSEVIEDDSGDNIGKKKFSDAKVVVPKIKIEDKKLKKTDIFHMLDGDEGAPVKTLSLAAIKRAREKEKRKAKGQEKVYREVIIPELITVGDLAARMSERSSIVVQKLLEFGVVANINQNIDADTAEIIVRALGHTFKRVQDSDVENLIISQEDTIENLQSRPPVVTTMGHVDHGKTSLLDALRSTDIAAKESGGITQQIGAYKVKLDNEKTITFIDTPGHEAFSAMRTRGTSVTDIVVLVVAADDGIKTQTIEAINHAKAANVPIIVAINKIDKPDINIEKVKNELLSYNIVSEEFGGDTIIVPVSALKKTNLDKLEEAILLVAEMLDLKANPNAAGSGVVIESRLDTGKGVSASILIKKGCLKIGDLVVAGVTYGRVRSMRDDKGRAVKVAYPSDPVEVFGLNMVPNAGDKIDTVQTDRQAKDIIEYRARLIKEKKNSAVQVSSLEDLFAKTSNTSKVKEIPLIIKADTQGAIGAIEASILRIEHPEIKVRIIASGVGGISDSDLSLAEATKAIVIGFNVRSNGKQNLGIDIRYYSIIYNLIDDIKAIMSGMLSPIIREQYIGSVEIREVFNITKVGKIAGCYVTKGVIKRGAGVRLLRDDVVVHEGKLKTLKRFKEEVKEVRENFECGIAFENYEDMRIGDKVEVFETVEEKQKLL